VTTTHTLSVLVEDKPGVLARISGLFSRRGYNIQSLAVGPTEEEGISLVMMKIRADASVRSQVLEVTQMFRAKVVDVAPEAVTVEATGTEDKLNALRRMLEPYGIREIVQSGMVALSRGPRSIAAHHR
jgi:acetolactate synthase I/III small subunit